MSELHQAPGIGPAIAAALAELGVSNLAELGRQDPEELFSRLCAQRDENIVRCVLFTFRCGVYFARKSQHDPRLRTWWNWKGPHAGCELKLTGGADGQDTGYRRRVF